MVYIDTSVIVKLYFKETCSLEAETWIKNNNQAILLTRLHDLEFINAVYLKQFRDEISGEQARLVLSRFDEHLQQGIYYRPLIEWSKILNIAIDLITAHTRHIGSRSLDILHVAAALSIKASRFLTFDDRQARLADLAGLDLVRIND